METLLQIRRQSLERLGGLVLCVSYDVQQHPVRHRIGIEIFKHGKSVDKKPPLPEPIPGEKQSGGITEPEGFPQGTILVAGRK